MYKIIIATILRPTGDTGVQTHINYFRDYLRTQQKPHQLITPFSYYKFLVYPIFATRKILDKISGEMSVWWYRCWHAYFLQQALKYRLQPGTGCVIYAQCPLSANAALRARVSKNQKVVMVTHFNISQSDEWVGKGLIANGSKLYRSIRRFETAVLPRLDGLVFVSKFMQQELTKRIPEIAKVKSAVIPNFLPDPGLPEMMRASADLINIGTLEARKNQQYLLKIVAALREQGNPLTLTIVGDGPDKSMLEFTARALKIDDLVHFTGYDENAAERVRMHKAYIHVAMMESFGISLIEAMARGRPVLAIPVGGIPEVLGNGIAGLALPLNDANEAALIIEEAMNNHAWMMRAGIAARERFLQEYVSDVVAKRLSAFLEGTIAVTL